jgi:FMN phosphatase YigB (HAD superfamily)
MSLESTAFGGMSYSRHTRVGGSPAKNGTPIGSCRRLLVKRIRQSRTIGFGAAGFRLALISNADTMEVAAWNDCPLAGLFDAEVFSCMVGCAKPEPAIYEKCLQLLGLSAAECLFVGDGGSNELVGARDVGMPTVFISGVIAELWPDRVQQRLSSCDHHVERIPQLLTLLGLTRLAADGGW